MAVDSTGSQGQPLFSDSNGFDLAVDQNAISNYAAGIVAGLSTNQASSGYLDLSSGWAYDSPTGLNAVIALGSLRIVTLAIYNSTAVSTGTTIAGMKTGHRPFQPIFVGGTIVDGGGPLATGSVYMAANGAIGVASFTPDTGSDGKFNGVRCTFIYVAG